MLDLAFVRNNIALIEEKLAQRGSALRLDEFRSNGVADLGAAYVERRGRAGILELRNPRHLNAEDGVTLGPTESAVDLILLDPDIEIGMIRGGVVDHPRYAGERVFGSGINLTHLYHGRIDFLFYLVRDLGYVNKIYRGLNTGQEKLWIATEGRRRSLLRVRAQLLERIEAAEMPPSVNRMLAEPSRILHLASTGRDL